MKYEDLDQAFDPKPTDKKIICVCDNCNALWIEYVNGCPKCENTDGTSRGHVVCRSVTKEEFEQLKTKEPNKR